MRKDSWRKLLCPKCHQLKKTCTCTNKPSAPSKFTVVKVGRETKGRRGKGVTVISDLALNEPEPNAVLDRPFGLPVRNLWVLLRVETEGWCPFGMLENLIPHLRLVRLPERAVVGTDEDLSGDWLWFGQLST